jgi:hypothetical protein
MENLQKLTENFSFYSATEQDPCGRKENVEIHKNRGFLKLDFNVKLSILSTPEWNNDLLFQRLNT